jgi:hypothetical protein
MLHGHGVLPVFRHEEETGSLRYSVIFSRFGISTLSSPEASPRSFTDLHLFEAYGKGKAYRFDRETSGTNAWEMGSK